MRMRRALERPVKGSFGCGCMCRRNCSSKSLKTLEILVDGPIFSGRPAAIAPAPPAQPRDRSGLAPPSTAADGPRASRRPGLSLADDDFRKAAGTTRWTRPRADFLVRRLSKLFKLSFHFVIVCNRCCICFSIL